MNVRNYVPTHQEWVEKFVEIYKSEPYLRNLNLKRKEES